MDFVNEQKNVFWLCDKCIDQFNAIKLPSSPSEIVSGVSEMIKDSLMELKSDLQETKALTQALAGKIKSTDNAGSNQARSAWPSIKRSRYIAEKETPKSRPDSKLVVGTKSVEKDNLTVDTVAKPPEKFWLYLSRIAPHVNEADILELVKNSLNTQELIDVRKLVRKGADLKQFAFISFKVGLDLKLKDAALDPSVWPKGIYFREFENMTSERDFWGPTKIPRMEDATPTASGTPMIVSLSTTATTPSQ